MAVILVNRNKGFTLVELMVGMAISLIIMAGAVYVFVNLSKTSLQEVRSARASQQARDVMAFIVRDVARAGYRGIEHQLNDPKGSNEFQNISVNSDGNCISYAYNRDDVTPSGAINAYAIRYQSNEVQIISGGDCDSSSGWAGISRSEDLSVSELTFSCISCSDDDDQKRVDVSLTAQSKDTADESLSVSIYETVNFMNKVVVSYE